MTTDIEIRSADSADSRAIATVHVESWRHAYAGLLPEAYLAALSVEEREAMWRSAFEQHPDRLVIASCEDRIVGFAAFGPSHDRDARPDRAEIYAIYVAPTYWSTGVGRRLLLETLRRFQAAGNTAASLWVLADNERAIRFYERAGFSVDPQSRKSIEIGGVALDEVRYLREVG
ncbi:MAG: GNAT family N-acetyltransferase [Xanthomonadaceae bacterium]|nr:GNAT family N-acetyltransferase [Xanthomonadaceae bacterium]